MKKRGLKRTSWIFAAGIALFLSTIILTPLSSPAADNYWTGASGLPDWKYTANWSLGDVPADGDNAFIINAGPVNLNMAQTTYPVPLNGSLQSLVIENGTLIHGGGYTLNVYAPPDPVEPWVNWNPPAIGFGVNGTYSLSENGTLNSARTVVGVGGLFDGDLNPTNNPPLSGGGGLGIFNQGGTTTANHGQLWVGFNTYGEYNLSGGTVNIGGYEMGTLVIGGKDWYGKTYVGEGVFNQTGGDVYVNGLGLFMADGPGTMGTYNLENGTLTVGGYYVIGGGGGTATFNQTGGTNTANGMLEVGGAGTGTYNLSAGNLNTGSTIVGAWGTGTFNQGLTGDGGTHTVAGTLEVGSHGSGTYNLIAGNLATGSTIVGNQGTGTFNQSGGTHTVSGELILGYWDSSGSGAYGEYNISAGELYTGQIVIGAKYSNGYQPGYGTFNQSGSGYVETGSLYLADTPGSTGTYNLSDGYLRVWSQFDVIGVQGIGTFNQTGGTHETGGLFVGGFWSNPGTGTYNLDFGNLTVHGDTILGDGGIGTFNQGLNGDGGTHQVDGNLIVGLTSGTLLNPNTYNLYNGTLNVTGSTIVGDQGVGVFNQSGGTHNTAALYLGFNGGNGTYNLYDGTLNVGGFAVIGGKDYTTNPGTGEFNQYGGTHTTGGLFLGDTEGSVGTYNLIGGDLTVSSQWATIGMRGTGTFNQTGGTFTTGGLALGGWVGTGNGTYNLELGTLTVNGNMYVGDWGIGTFNQSGGSSVIGDALVVGATATGVGTYNISDGTLSANFVQVAREGKGTFNQTGGSVTISGLTGDLNLGQASGSIGSYDLSGDPSILTVGRMINIGIDGKGTFTQTGGTVTAAGGLILGGAVSGDGTYNLSSGSIATGYEKIGISGTGYFSQSGGKNTTEDLAVGDETGGTGSYVLSGSGKLSVSKYDIRVGVKGTGSFTQGSGTENTVTRTLVIGQLSGGIGTYTMDGGNLSMGANLRIGNGAGSNGTFIFNDGTVSVGGTTYVGNEGTGILNQTGGSLTTASMDVGTKGTGTLTQNGLSSSVNVTNNLVLGREAGSVGTYNLIDGTLLTGAVTVGRSGTGTFTQTGGIHTATNEILIAANPGSLGTYELKGGTLTAANIINNDKFNYSGGNLNANITNNALGTVTITGGTPVDPLVVNGNVNSWGLFKLTAANVVYNGTFNNYGDYISDPSTSTFQDLIIKSGGRLIGDADDQFIIAGDFEIDSGGSLNPLIALTFGPGSHEFMFTGILTFAQLILDSNGQLNIIGGLGSVLDVTDFSGDPSDIVNAGSNPVTIYYDDLNDTGQGGTVEIPGSGQPVPEPSTLLLLGSGLLGAAGFLRRRFKKN